MTVSLRTTIALACLFLISVISSTAMVDENSEPFTVESLTQLSGSNNGADPAVMDLVYPRATSIDSITGEMRNTIFAGDYVTFEAYIQNLGDSDILDLQITVEIKNAEAGVAGSTATDSSGNQLKWTNSDVICNDWQSCPYSSLSSGDFLADGLYTMQFGGNQLNWTPQAGEYFIEISVDTNGENTDETNDLISKYVAIKERHNLRIDVEWYNGYAIGTGSHDFTVEVSVGGSSVWDARDVSIYVKAKGDLSSATGEGSENLFNGVVINLGRSTNVEKSHNTTSGEKEYGNSKVIDYGTTWYWNGTVTGDPNSDPSFFVVEATLLQYTRYGAHPECVEASFGNDANDTQIYENLCEVSLYNDDDESDNFAYTTGSIDQVDDLAVVEVGIGQWQENTQGDFPDRHYGDEDTLNTGESLLYAIVEHAGSSTSESYDWKVVFIVEDSFGSGTILYADECVSGIDPWSMYSHSELDDFGRIGFACTTFDFSPGHYTVNATVVGVGSTNDEYSQNDEISINVDVENNAPMINSLDVETEGPLVFGSSSTVSLTSSAFDSDDLTGDTLSYDWTRQNGASLPCSGQGHLYSTCEISIDSSWIPSERITLKVTDEYGEYDAKTIDVVVWNYAEKQDTTTSGITVHNSLTYGSAQSYSFTVQDSTNEYSNRIMTDEQGNVIQGYFFSAATFEFNPNIVLSDSEILSHSIKVLYPSNLNAESLWFTDNGEDWVMLSDDALNWDSSTNMFVVHLDNYSLSSSLQYGELVLFQHPSGVLEEPDAISTIHYMNAIKGGGFSLGWSIIGTATSDDWFNLTICEYGNPSSCIFDGELNITTLSIMIDGSQTNHGTSYKASLKVCNSALCNYIPATASAYSDSLVEGKFDVKDMSIASEDDKWTVTWIIDGSDADIAQWKVCYQSEDFSANEMYSGTCSIHDSMTAVIDQPHKSVNGTYPFYFSAAPMDYLGNIRLEGSMGHTKMVVGDPCHLNPETGNCAMDSDNDGVYDYLDAFPNDASETLDSDDDGVGDNEDAFPFDDDETKDSDEDGVGDNEDAFPFDDDETKDSDDDGVGDNEDAFPNDAKETKDSDGDGVGDNADAFPNDPDESKDSDGDGVGDKADPFPEMALFASLTPIFVIIGIVVVGMLSLVFFLRRGGEGNEFEDHWHDETPQYMENHTYNSDHHHSEPQLVQKVVPPVAPERPMTPPSHPSAHLESNNGVSDGYEWLRHNENNYYRIHNSNDVWEQWD